MSGVLFQERKRLAPATEPFHNDLIGRNWVVRGILRIAIVSPSEDGKL